MKTKIIFLFSLFLFSLVFTGCSNKIEDEQAFPHTVTSVSVVQGNLYGNGREGISKQAIVITANAEWESLINKMNSVNQVTGDFSETAIDFSKYTVIAVFDGVKSSGGWSIDITDIIEYPDSVTVSVKNLHTGGATAVMTQPFHIVKIPVSKKKVMLDWEKSYPQKMEISEVFSQGFNCELINTYFPSYDNGWIAVGQTYIINSQEEIMCSEDNILADFDFNKYSLLIVCFTSNGGYIDEQLQQTSDNTYTLSFTVKRTLFQINGENVFLYWKTPKINRNSAIELKIDYLQLDFE